MTLALVVALVVSIPVVVTLRVASVVALLFVAWLVTAVVVVVAVSVVASLSAARSSPCTVLISAVTAGSVVVLIAESCGPRRVAGGWAVLICSVGGHGDVLGLELFDLIL